MLRPSQVVDLLHGVLVLILLIVLSVSHQIVGHGAGMIVLNVMYTGKFIYQDGTAQDIASIITPRTIVKYEH